MKNIFLILSFFILLSCTNKKVFFDKEFNENVQLYETESYTFKYPANWNSFLKEVNYMEIKSKKDFKNRKRIKKMHFSPSEIRYSSRQATLSTTRKRRRGKISFQSKIKFSFIYVQINAISIDSINHTTDKTLNNNSTKTIKDSVKSDYIKFKTYILHKKKPKNFQSFFIKKMETTILKSNDSVAIITKKIISKNRHGEDNRIYLTHYYLKNRKIYSIEYSTNNSNYTFYLNDFAMITSSFKIK